ncbi:MAG TPA: HAMP domain-containing sensor histidine kinase, partial [Anseongella sp.]|nr:HAMP domain-containing sensor histidine kinase [Anseongella sp.]
KSSIPSIVTVQPYRGVNIVSLRDSAGNFQTDISFNLHGFNRVLSLPEFEYFLQNSVSTQIAYRNGQMYFKESPPFGIRPQELREKVLEHQKIVEKQLTNRRVSGEKAPEDIRFLQITANGQVRPITSGELQQIQQQQAAAAKAESFMSGNSLEQELKQFVDSLEKIKERVKVFEELAAEMQRVQLPLKERVNPALVDSLLKDELQNQGIFLPYDIEIRAAENDSLLFASHQTGGEASQEIYKAALFPQDLVKGTSGELILKIPNKDRYLLRKMNLLTGSSGALILVIVVCFALTVYSILRQKKLSRMKSDFINNMTHEFKTPVATIMLASEALKDAEMSANKEQVTRYAGIIYDENLRLGSYVERVLNMARLEKSDFRLERKEVGVNELINAVVESMDLQLKKKKAKLELILEAAGDRITGDELHLSNVIYNLVDNAVKYSPAGPEIRIRTFNEDQKLKIAVSDKGIGMSKEQRKKIFEKFYRVQSGNLHDIKGFGLGLSYVNSIVKLLDGNIKVRSELNKGSEFEITFPLSRP